MNTLLSVFSILLFSFSSSYSSGNSTSHHNHVALFSGATVHDSHASFTLGLD